MTILTTYFKDSCKEVWWVGLKCLPDAHQATPSLSSQRGRKENKMKKLVS